MRVNACSQLYKKGGMEPPFQGTYATGFPTAKQSPGLFLPNATHLEPRVASSNLVNKQKRKQDILKNVLLPFGRGDKI